MSVETTRRGRADRRAEGELLLRLGLPPDASKQDVETARDDLVQFLETAPAGLHVWARREIGLIDEAFALLSDEGGELTVARPGAQRDVAALSGAEVAVASERVSAAARPAPSRGDLGSREGFRGPRFRPAIRLAGALAGVAAVIAIVYAVYAAGAAPLPPLGTPAAEASAGIDAAQVAQLMQAIQADPKDTTSLAELGDIYFQAGQYDVAADWMTKILAVDPQNVNALLGLGAAKFNQGDAAGAETEWRSVISIEPNNQEAYYDLGYAYLSQTPPDNAEAKAMWDKVVAIDPSTSLAQTAQTHLDSLFSAAPSAGTDGAAGADAGASGSPAASVAPSAAAPEDTSAPPSPAASPGSSAGN